MKTLAWTMTMDVAMEFFERCQERGAKTEQEKIDILFELTKEGKMSSIVSTRQSKDEYIEEKAKHFKILKVKEV